jgi:hypothetical protein
VKLVPLTRGRVSTGDREERFLNKEVAKIAKKGSRFY